MKYRVPFYVTATTLYKELLGDSYNYIQSSFPCIGNHDVQRTFLGASYHDVQSTFLRYTHLYIFLGRPQVEHVSL